MTSSEWSIALHGGAGMIVRGSLRDDQEAAYRRALSKALVAARRPLEDGGSALDAVEAGVRFLEASPLFNAAIGATFTFDGRVELDAAIMDGATGEAGAVASIDCTLHPVTLARAVMERSPHVLLFGEGAAAFANELGYARPEPGAFVTEERWRSLVDLLGARGDTLPARPAGHAVRDSDSALVFEEGKYGTVGVVARDRAGRLASATSTGGVLAKRWGRVGDAPLIGAGTWADGACAVSTTGQGEYFIRVAAGRSVAALVEYAAMPLGAAISDVLRGIADMGGVGGMIGVAANGDIEWRFNTPGMFRAGQRSDGPERVCLYGDEA